MRVVLRLLIALNWTVAGLSFMMTIYEYPKLVWYECIDMAREDVQREHPQLKFGSEAYNRLEYERAEAHHHRVDRINKLGHTGWAIATGVGTITAIGLMAVFPKKSPAAPN